MAERFEATICQNGREGLKLDLEEEYALIQTGVLQRPESGIGE